MFEDVCVVQTTVETDRSEAGKEITDRGILTAQHRQQMTRAHMAWPDDSEDVIKEHA